MSLRNLDRQEVLAQQRADLGAERKRIEQAYAVAVLDDMAAYVRAACPPAVYVTFAYDGASRTPELLGVLGAQPSRLGACPWLWDGNARAHPLNDYADRLAQDLREALAPADSPAWATVGPNAAGEGNSWLLELPPPDRAVRVAELVRQHYANAIAVVVDQRRAGGQVIEIVEGFGRGGAETRTTPAPWPCRCGDAIARLVVQMFALPSLADRHFTQVYDYLHPYGGPSDLVRVMPLPPTE